MHANRSASVERKHRFGADFTRRIASLFRNKNNPSSRPQQAVSSSPQQHTPSSLREDEAPRSLRSKVFHTNSHNSHPQQPASFSASSSLMHDFSLPDPYSTQHVEPRSVPSHAFEQSPLHRIPGISTNRATSDNRAAAPISSRQRLTGSSRGINSQIVASVPNYLRSRNRKHPSKSAHLTLSKSKSRPPKKQNPTTNGQHKTKTSRVPSIEDFKSDKSLQIRFETDRHVVHDRQRSELHEEHNMRTTAPLRALETSQIPRPTPTKPTPKRFQHRAATMSTAKINHSISSPRLEPPSNRYNTEDYLTSRNLRHIREVESQMATFKQTSEQRKQEAQLPSSRRKVERKKLREGLMGPDADLECDDTSSLSSALLSSFAAPLSARSMGGAKKDLTPVEPQSSLFSSPVEEYESLSPQGEQAAQSLERIARTIDDFDEGKDEKGKEAVIPILIEAINQYRQDPLVADRALTLLRRFTVSTNCRRALGEAGAVETIVAIMNAHNLRVRIAAQGCLALGNLCFHEDANKARVLDHGIPVVVAAMALHTEAEQTQAWGALALRNCTNNLDAEAEGPLGAVEVLVAAVEAYTKSEVVISNSLAALSNIARTQGKDAIVQAGGVSVLLGTLEKNSRNQKLSELALSLCVGVIEDDAMCAFFGSQGGVEIITSILEIHKGDTIISCLGSAVLRVLAFNAQNRKKFASCGTLRGVVSALDTVAADGSAAKVNIVMKALANIVFDSAGIKVEAGKLRVIEITMSVMLRLAQSELVAEAGMRVVRNLTDQNRENGGVLVGHPQGLANIAWIAQMHGKSSAGVAEHTIACLVNLCVTKRFATEIRNDVKLITLVRELREAHFSNRRVHTQASKLRTMLELS